MLGPYELQAPLGAGGMATVFAAKHLGLQKLVAVKVLRPHVSKDERVRRRFVREGVVASRVRHPHVVDVTDVGEHDGRAYLVMEHLEGECLGARMMRLGPMPVAEVLTMLLPIIGGLAAAHRAGVIHRDVKPENIFLAKAGEGHEISKLLDFGISRTTELGLERLTDSSVVLGTAQYMAPEQARGVDADARVDQYALAVVVYESICGALPYRCTGNNVIDLMAEIARGAVTPLVERWPSAPPELSAVLAKALSGAREDRYETMEDFGHALLPFASRRGARRFRELCNPDWSATDERPPSALSYTSAVHPVVEPSRRAEALTLVTGEEIVHRETPAERRTGAWGTRRRWSVAAAALALVVLLGAGALAMSAEGPVAELVTTRNE